MSTFKELQEKMEKAQQRRQIALALIEYLDSNFRSIAGEPARFKLLVDKKLEVPEGAFEDFIGEVLQDAVNKSETAINEVNSATISPATESVQSAPAPVPPVPFIPVPLSPATPPAAPQPPTSRPSSR